MAASFSSHPATVNVRERQVWATDPLRFCAEALRG